MKKSIVAKVLAFSFLISTFTGVTIPNQTVKAEESTSNSTVTTGVAVEVTQESDNTTTVTTEYSNEFDETTGNYKYNFTTHLKSGQNYYENLTSADLGVSVTPNVKPDVLAVPETFIHEAPNGVTYEYKKVVTSVVYYKAQKKVESTTTSTSTPIVTSRPTVAPLVTPVPATTTSETSVTTIKASVDESYFEKCIGWYDGQIIRKNDIKKATKIYKKYKNKKKFIIKTNSKLETARIEAAFYYKYCRYADESVLGLYKKESISKKHFKELVKLSKKAIKKKDKYYYKKAKKRQQWMTKFMNYALEVDGTRPLRGCEKYSEQIRYNTAMHEGYLLAIKKFDLKYNEQAQDYIKGWSKTPSKYGNGQSVYEIIDYQTAVCGGIANFTKMYYNSLGIKCKYVSNIELDHAWNVVPEGVINHHCKIIKLVDYTKSFSRNGRTYE